MYARNERTAAHLKTIRDAEHAMTKFSLENVVGGIVKRKQLIHHNLNNHQNHNRQPMDEDTNKNIIEHIHNHNPNRWTRTIINYS